MHSPIRHHVLVLKHTDNFVPNFVLYLGGKRTVGIATRYRLDDTGIESRLGWRDYLHLSRPALGPSQSPVQWVPGLLPEGKVAEVWL